MHNTHLRHHESLNTIGARDMRTNAKIYHRATTIDRRGSSIRDFRLNNVFFVFIVLIERLDLFRSSYVNLLTENISKSVSFGTTRRSNFCFSLIALSETFSSAG